MASRERRRNLARKCAASIALYLLRTMLTISSVQSLQNTLSASEKAVGGNSCSQRTQGLSSGKGAISFRLTGNCTPVPCAMEVWLRQSILRAKFDKGPHLCNNLCTS